MDVLTLGIILIAGVVIYFLWNTLREYLSVEENLKRFQERETLVLPQPKEKTLEDEVRESEYGILAGILGYVGNADNEICDLEKEMGFSLLNDMAKEMKKIGDEQSVLEELQKIFLSKDNQIKVLAEQFVELTKGEYKKKLKVVEFCFALGYADGELNDATKEAILDVGAFLGIDNEDFNAIYDDFAQHHQAQLSLEEAKEMFGDYEDLYVRYQELIAQNQQNILDERSQTAGTKHLTQLQKIQKAYELLKSQSS